MVIGILDDPMTPPWVLADLILGVTRTDQHFATVAGWQISSSIKSHLACMRLWVQGPVLTRVGLGLPKAGSPPPLSVPTAAATLTWGWRVPHQRTTRITVPSPGRKDGIQTRSR